MPKPSRSAFYFFASEYQHRYERTHGHRISINEAINSCYDDWKVLTEEQKQPYKDLYEQWRTQYRTDPTSMVEPKRQGNQRKIKKQENILSQRDIPSEQLKTHFDRFSIERDFLAFEYFPLDLQELLYMPIYIVNFQIFCKVDEEDGGQYVPAELAFVRYTLAEGVTLCRHAFIKPERFPTGYMSACLEHLKDTHEIPLRDFAQATDHYSMIYEQIKSVIVRDDQSTAANSSENSDRERRRSLRSRQPCVFFPAVEYDQTAQLFDWLQTKAEGVKPTKDTRLVNFASVESLIMLLAELKQQRVYRDDIQKTFESAAYSYMIEDRCSYHLHLGISHCSVVRCYAAAKLIGAYLNQLYVPERTVLSTMNAKRTLNSAAKKSDRVSVVSMNTTSHRASSPSTTPKPSMMDKSISSSQYSTAGASDSIASSYRPPVQMKKSSEPTSTSEKNRGTSAKYSYQAKPIEDSITDDLIHHPTIMKLQQQNFNRLISSVTSTASSSSSVVELPKASTNLSMAQPATSQRTNFSSRLSTPTGEHLKVNQAPMSDDQHMILNQRKQALLQAIRNIDQQMEELNMS